MNPTDETYTEWQNAYNHFNKELFAQRLPNCLITFQREKKSMGYFSHNRFSNRKGVKTDEIALNPVFFAGRPVNEALQTLAHEMVHLWQAHYGQPGRGKYHNKEWADKMESIGLMPSSTGQQGGKRTGDNMSDYIITGAALDRSIVKLKASGSFVLIWMDRHVAKPIKPLASGIQSANDSNLVQATPSDSGHIDQGLEIQLDNEEIGFTPVTQKQGTRVKYSCDCGINVWAKPGIDITCNKCQTVFGD